MGSHDTASIYFLFLSSLSPAYFPLFVYLGPFFGWELLGADFPLAAELASLTRLISSVRLTTATSRPRSSRLKNPTKVVPLERLNASHSTCNMTAVAKAPTTFPFTTARPAFARSRQSTAHTNPVHAACPAGDVSPRAISTSSRTPRFPPDWSSVVNP